MADDTERATLSAGRHSARLTRRDILLTGGAALAGTTLFGALSDIAWGQTTKQPGVTTKNGGAKPIFVPESGT